MKANLWPIRPVFTYTFTGNADGSTQFAIAAARGSLHPLAFLGSVVMRKVLAKRGPEALQRLKAILERDPSRTMRAAEFRRFGDPETVLELNELAPRPNPGPGQIVVRIAASSINPIEPKRVRGYGAAMLRFRGGTDWPITLGADFAGQIAEIGPDVSGFAVGDAVFGVTDIGSRGTHAEFAAIDARNARAIPTGIDPAQAAALPYAWLTAWSALVSDCEIDQRSGRLLVRGASGGTGMAAIMIARNLGWQADAVCKSDARELVLKVGAEDVFAYDLDEPWPEGRYDVILDCVGDPDFEQVRSALASDGARLYATLVHPTLALGDKHGALPGLLRAKRRRAQLAKHEKVNVKWSVFSFDQAALDALRLALPQIAGSIAIDRTFSLEQITRAYEYVETGGLRGKVVLNCR